MSKVIKKTRGKRNIKKRYTKKIRSNRRSKGSKRRGSKRRESKKRGSKGKVSKRPKRPTRKGPKKRLSQKKVRAKKVTYMEGYRPGPGWLGIGLPQPGDLPAQGGEDGKLAESTLQQPEIFSMVTQRVGGKKGESIANMSSVSKGTAKGSAPSKLELKRDYIEENKEMFLESLPLYEPFMEMKENKGNKYDRLIEFYLNPDKKNTSDDPEFGVLSEVDQALKERIENLETIGPEDYDPIAPWPEPMYTFEARKDYWRGRGGEDLPDYRVSKIKYDETRGRPLMFLEFIDLPKLTHLNLTGHFVRPINNEHDPAADTPPVLQPLSKLTTCEELVISVDPWCHEDGAPGRIALDLFPIKEMTNLQRFTLEMPVNYSLRLNGTLKIDRVTSGFTNEMLMEMNSVSKQGRDNYDIWAPHDDTMEFNRA